MSIASLDGARTPSRLLAAGALCALLLAACNAGGGSANATPGASILPDEPHLELQSLEGLFGAAGAHLQTSGDLELIAFRCTVVEGTFCWFGESTQDGPVASQLARQVVDQIGSGAIENANRNEVAIQCYRPTDDGAPYCEVDWGWGAGWEPLPLG